MNILLVEDNPADMRLVREAVAEHALDATLHWVSSGEAALNFLRRQGADHDAPVPDLVLLDLNLPGVHGHEVLQAIKSDPATLHIPVVVLSSSAEPSDVLRAYRSHGNAYVVKPDDFERFIELVGSIQSYWFEAVRLPSQAQG